jgi:hypothetical protein
MTADPHDRRSAEVRPLKRPAARAGLTGVVSWLRWHWCELGVVAGLVLLAAAVSVWLLLAAVLVVIAWCADEVRQWYRKRAAVDRPVPHDDSSTTGTGLGGTA